MCHQNENVIAKAAVFSIPPSTVAIMFFSTTAATKSPWLQRSKYSPNKERPQWSVLDSCADGNVILILKTALRVPLITLCPFMVAISIVASLCSLCYGCCKIKKITNHSVKWTIWILKNLQDVKHPFINCIIPLLANPEFLVASLSITICNYIDSIHCMTSVSRTQSPNSQKHRETHIFLSLLLYIPYLCNRTFYKNYSTLSL